MEQTGIYNVLIALFIGVIVFLLIVRFAFRLDSLKKDIKYVNGLIDYFSDDKKRVLNMVDYFTGKINKHENYNLVLENGKYASEQEIINRKKYISKQFNKSNIWQVVLSFDKKFIDENISWRDLELKLAKEILPMFFKKIGFDDIKNMSYQIALHSDTDNLHYHF